jgi:hypothetical protein
MQGGGGDIMVEYYDNIKQELGRIPLLGFLWPVIAYLCFLTVRSPEIRFLCRCYFLPSVKQSKIIRVCIYCIYFFVVIFIVCNMCTFLI